MLSWPDLKGGVTGPDAEMIVKRPIEIGRPIAIGRPFCREFAVQWRPSRRSPVSTFAGRQVARMRAVA
jgi:hypothetical protein